MERLCSDADEAIDDGYTLLILSDRGVDAENAPIPALLAIAGLNNHLTRERKRTRVGCRAGDGGAPRGAPLRAAPGLRRRRHQPVPRSRYARQMVDEGLTEPGIDYDEAVEHYLKACKKAVVKIMSKMGISTIQSYRGAQIFEAIGLSHEFIDRYFTYTASRIGGVGIEEIALDMLAHHRRAFPEREGGLRELLWGGQYQWRRDGEFHLFNPETIFRLQHSTRTNQQGIFREYTPPRRRAGRAPVHAARPLRDQVGPQPGPDRGSRAGGGDLPPLRHRRHELRLDRRGGARDAGDRDEPHRRQEQHRRGRRGPPPLHPGRQRRLPPLRDQAGGFGALRRHQRVPGERRRTADQDGAGGQARRGRPAPRPQGLALDRQGPLLHPRRRTHQPAAAPRHLLDRGPGAADPRPQEQQPAGPDQREARRRGRRRDGRRGRRQGQVGRRPDQRPRRRHRRQPDHLDQARGHPLGARASPRPSRRSC